MNARSIPSDLWVGFLSYKIFVSNKMSSLPSDIKNVCSVIQRLFVITIKRSIITSSVFLIFLATTKGIEFYKSKNSDDSRIS